MAGCAETENGTAGVGEGREGDGELICGYGSSVQTVVECGQVVLLIGGFVINVVRISYGVLRWGMASVTVGT